MVLLSQIISFKVELFPYLINYHLKNCVHRMEHTLKLHDLIFEETADSDPENQKRQNINTSTQKHPHSIHNL